MSQQTITHTGTHWKCLQTKYCWRKLIDVSYYFIFKGIQSVYENLMWIPFFFFQTGFRESEHSIFLLSQAPLTQASLQTPLISSTQTLIKGGVYLAHYEKYFWKYFLSIMYQTNKIVLCHISKRLIATCKVREMVWVRCGRIISFLATVNWVWAM